MYVIRVAAGADVEVLVELELEEAREAEDRALDPAAVRAAVGAAIARPELARYWMLDEDGEVVGAIAVTTEWSDWSNASYWWIQFVYLRPAARGRGGLAAMVDHVEREARAAGAPELRLYVHPANARAVRAYEKLGFGPLPYRVMSRSLRDR